jgi:hypothetical protein
MIRPARESPPDSAFSGPDLTHMIIQGGVNGLPTVAALKSRPPRHRKTRRPLPSWPREAPFFRIAI